MEKIVLTHPTSNSNRHNQSVTTPADKNSPLSKTSLTTDTSQTLFVKKDSVYKFINDVVEGVETSFKAKSVSVTTRGIYQQ